MKAIRDAARVTLGVLLGVVTAVVDIGYVLLAGAALIPSSVWPHTPRGASRVIGRGAGALTRLERRRLNAFLGSHDSTNYSDNRALRYLALRWLVGALDGCVMLMLAFGLWAVAAMVLQHRAGPCSRGRTGRGELLRNLLENRRCIFPVRLQVPA